MVVISLFFSLRSVNYIGWNELIEFCRSVDSSRNNRQSCLLYLCYESADRKIFIIYRTKNYDVWIFHFGLSWNLKRREKEYIYKKKKRKIGSNRWEHKISVLARPRFNERTCPTATNRLIEVMTQTAICSCVIRVTGMRGRNQRVHWAPASG